jgi:hypothetical protein
LHADEDKVLGAFVSFYNLVGNANQGSLYVLGGHEGSLRHKKNLLPRTGKRF